MEMNLEALRELLEGPSVIFTRVMTREVGGGNVRDGFGVYTYDLIELVNYDKFKELSPV